MADSQASMELDERFFDDPSQLSQLLRQRAGSDRALHFTTSTESHQSGITASNSPFAVPPPPLHAAADPKQQLSVVPALSRDALSSRRVATARNVNFKPALSTHHSAPTSTGFVKDMEGVLRMHRSFGGMDAPGDTQPDSQIYKQYTSGIHGTESSILSKIPSPKSLFTEHVDDDDADSPTDGIDMVESSQEQHSPTATSPTVTHEHDHGHSGALAPSLYAPTSPLKFETPALAGRKRGSSHQMLSSAVRTNTTPGTVDSAAVFPGFGMGTFAPMSLTQVWQNTQAPTSPALPEASEDVAFTRPSPNFTHARHSSPVPALSSPIKAMRDDSPRTDPIMRSSSEPRAEYVSMKESQERRKRTLDEQPAHLVEQDSWEKPSAAQLRLQKKKKKEHLERKAAMSFAYVSAPMPPSPESGKKRRVTSSIYSPVKSRSSRSVARALDEDTSAELAQVMTTTQPHDDDSPDELSQDIPSTARSVVKRKSKDNSVQVPKTSSHPTRTLSGRTPRASSQVATPSSQLERESQLQAPASQPLLRETIRPHSSRESVAIMDSQPGATADFESIPRPKSLRFPSSPSTNQYSINQTTMATKTGYTSQVISSSVPPMPPRSSPDVAADDSDEEVTPEGEEGVPSSPPITTLDDDLTYDEHEHAYDEYAEDTEVRDSIEPEELGGAMINEDDEELPVATPIAEDEGEDTNMKDEDADEDEEAKPLKVDIGTDEEVPETLEQDAPPAALSEEMELVRPPIVGLVEHSDESHPLQPPRMQRQNTVPETDALEETQPSLFPDTASVIYNGLAPVHEGGLPDQTNSNDPFHTAQERLSGSQRDQPPPLSSRENGSDSLQTGDRIHSVQDLYNLPDTQQSAMEDEIEMPRLSGLDDDDALMAITSPAFPSAKRRKVTYTAKHNAFPSPLKSRTAALELQPEPPTPSPVNQVRSSTSDIPPMASTQDRELQGADAALEARQGAQAPYTRQATLKSKSAPRPLRAQAQKKGTLKSVSKELLQSLSSPANSPAKSKPATERRTSTPTTPTKRGTHKGAAAVDVDMQDAADLHDELADPTPEHQNNTTIVQTVSDFGEQPTGDIIVTNRVFASWPGSHFYPAICVGRASGRQLQIRFDDGNTTALEASQVRAFDLHPGDHVKVDKVGLKKHTYVVVGFKDKIEDVEAEQRPTTDRHGYATVVLEEKRRDSLPAAKAAQPVEHISAPMASIYLTTQLWARLRGRSFTFSPSTSPTKPASRVGTPITVDPIASLSFSRRGTTVPSLLKGATARAASVTSSSTRSGSGVFSNMAFVLTSTAMDVNKEEVARVIKTNGGLVLEQGFHELFDHESTGPLSSSEPRRHSASESGDAVGLSLKPVYKDLGFVALISDSHSRSTKYIQALALNVPCLHLRWVHDSLAASRAVSFIKYLLPAGVSKFLDPNGVVRSRTMNPYDPAAEDVSFAQTISDRDLLLRNQSVLLVTGKSKKEIEKRQPFVFLTHALGSAAVGRCADLIAATDMLQHQQWDWIYVDNGEAGVADAAAELFGTGKRAAKPKKGKKRKREEAEDKEELVARGEVEGKKIKITCAEFVIQSLILGSLVEE